jgi:hypothetical protein
MKAFVISEYAHHSKIPLTLDAPDPILEKDSDSLLIDVYSAGLNFFDVCASVSPKSPSLWLHYLRPTSRSSKLKVATKPNPHGHSFSAPNSQGQ